ALGFAVITPVSQTTGSWLADAGSWAAIAAATFGLVAVAGIATAMARRRLFPRLRIEVAKVGTTTATISNAPGVTATVPLNVFGIRVTSLESARGAALIVRYYRPTDESDPLDEALVPPPQGDVQDDGSLTPL